MNITFSYTAHLKAAAGATSQTLRVKDGSTLNDCFRTLCDAIPPTLYTSLVDSDGKLRPAILLCVDDQQKNP